MHDVPEGELSCGTMRRIGYFRISSLIGMFITCITIDFLYTFIDWPPPRAIKSIRGSRQKETSTTLGFDKIFVIGLPSRSDKRDAMTLAAKLTNLDITWIDGINGSSMSTSEIPPAFFDTNITALSKLAQIGSWRGHMNAIRQIIEDDLSSALILEDDVDWDINIATQLQQFSKASSALLASYRNDRAAGGADRSILLDRASSYAAVWDLLWLGHCGGWAPPPDARRYAEIISQDATVPPSVDIYDMLQGVARDQQCAAHRGRDPEFLVCNKPRLLPDQRIVQMKNSPVCSFAYALSQEGATKALARMGGPALADVDSGFDTKLTEFCRGDMDIVGGEETICLTVSPPYFVHHRRKGSVSGDSDIDMPPTEEAEREIRETGYTKGIVWSTMLNIGNLIEGRLPESQYTWIDERRGWRFKRADEYRGYPAEREAGYRPGIGNMR
jgi:hypothetical protein